MRKPIATILSPLCIAAFVLVLSGQVLAEQTVVHGARIWNAPDHTRIVLDVAGPVSHNIFPLDNPPRLVVDLTDARLKGKLPGVDSDDVLVSGLRSGVRDGDDLRVVMDLKQSAKIKSFELDPNDTYGHRLVIDLSPKNPVDTAAVLAAATATASPSIRKREGATRRESKFLSVQPKGGGQRNVIVAVDAGHGGEDPGAVGGSGTREKDVTLAIARKLAARIDKQKGMQAVLIRDGDYFVALRQRIAKARKHKADLFVSIHADAFTDSRVRGSSVYTLSNGGATSEAAKWLAARENRADLIGGVNLSERNDVLAGVLLDMSMNATIEHSSIAATRVLEKLRSLGHVHQTRIQQAGFVVLKSPDIPSMLVETAFISNPDEEKRLRNVKYQNQLADSLLAGILDYFQEYPPPGTRFARQTDRGRDARSDASDLRFDPADVPTRLAGISAAIVGASSSTAVPLR
ncbi:MAG: N-acetylmuramoyl-L-alanine amidase [Thiohalocapsa sp.]